MKNHAKIAQNVKNNLCLLHLATLEIYKDEKLQKYSEYKFLKLRNNLKKLLSELGIYESLRITEILLRSV